MKKDNDNFHLQLLGKIINHIIILKSLAFPEVFFVNSIERASLVIGCNHDEN